MVENVTYLARRLAIDLHVRRHSSFYYAGGRSLAHHQASATPVSDDYGPKDSAFTGRVAWVEIDIDEAAEDFDHLITPEERLRVAMARQ